MKAAEGYPGSAGRAPCPGSWELHHLHLSCSCKSGEVSGMSVGQRPPAQLVRGIEARAHLQAQLFVVGRMGPSPRERRKHGGLKRPSTGPFPCRARSPRAGQRRGGVSDPAAAGTWGCTRLTAQAARWVCFQIKTHTEHTEQCFTPRTKKQTPGEQRKRCPCTP